MRLPLEDVGWDESAYMYMYMYMYSVSVLRVHSQPAQIPIPVLIGTWDGMRGKQSFI